MWITAEGQDWWTDDYAESRDSVCQYDTEATCLATGNECQWHCPETQGKKSSSSQNQKADNLIVYMSTAIRLYTNM